MCVEALRVALAAGETFVAFCVAVFVAACAGACRTCRKRRGPLVAASITFEEAAEAARTGDVLIFTSDPSDGNFWERVCKAGAGPSGLLLDECPQHVAVVLRGVPRECLAAYACCAGKPKDAAKLAAAMAAMDCPEDATYVLEATGVSNGCTISPIRDWMKRVTGWGYGSIFLRKRLSPSRDDPFPPINVAPVLWAWVQEMNYLPYLVDTTELRSFFRTQWMRRKPPNFEARIEALFCSEAVAETLQRCGVLDTTRPSYSYHPQDYLPGHYSGATFDKRLCSGVAYGELMRVRGPDNEAV